MRPLSMHHSIASNVKLDAPGLGHIWAPFQTLSASYLAGRAINSQSFRGTVWTVWLLLMLPKTRLAISEAFELLQAADARSEAVLQTLQNPKQRHLMRGIGPECS